MQPPSAGRESLSQGGPAARPGATPIRGQGTPLDSSEVRTAGGRPSSIRQATGGATAGKFFQKRKSPAARVARALGRVAFVAAPLVLLIAAAAAAGYVKLLHSPMSLASLVEPIERGISQSLGVAGVEIDDAQLTLADDGDVEVRLSNLRLAEGDGDRLMTVPLAAVEVDFVSLLMLEVVPKRIYLIGPQLSVSYAEGSGLSMSIANPGKPGDGAVGGAASTDASGTSRPDGVADGTSPPAQTAKAPAPSPAMRSLIGKIDLARWWTETTARGRRGEDASSAIREVGVRNATVTLDYEGQRSQWQVAEASLDILHRKRRSIASGSARVMGERGPWAISFRAEDSERTRSISVTTTVRDLVPSTLASAIPALSLLNSLDLPVSGDGSIELTSQGDLNSAALALALSQGRVGAPGMALAPIMLDAGKLDIRYDGARNAFSLAPSTLHAAGSHVVLEGGATAVTGRGGRSQWRFTVRSREGEIAAGGEGASSVPITSLVASGVVVPGEGALRLDGAKLVVGGAEVSLEGEVASAAAGGKARFEGKISPMPVETLKALWPRGVSPAAREWIGKAVTRGRLQSGSLRLTSGSPAGVTGADGAGDGDRLSVALELADLHAVAVPDAPAIDIPRALVRLENEALEVTIPDAAIASGAQTSVALKGGRFTAVGVAGASPVGEAVFRLATTVPAVVALASRPPLSLVADSSIPVEGLDGKIDGQFRISFPLAATGSFADTKVQGEAHITELRTKNKIGSIELQGGTIKVDVAEQAIDASGDLLLNGVVANLAWQRIFDAAPERQPPLRIKAVLDGTDRTQLGLDVNHIVQGEMPVEVTVAAGSLGKPAVHVRADLSGAELVFHDAAWRKPAGKTAFMDFDLGTGEKSPVELHNVKIAGDNIAVEGWAALNSDNDLSEFYFPDFSLNVVSRLEVQGKLGPDKVWKIKATGATHDARDFFTAMFALGSDREARIKPLRPAAGVDLEADVSNVLGHNEASVRGLKLKVSERGEKMVALSVQGTLDGGKALWASLKREANGDRVMTAGSGDAGQAFKLAGFYRNLIGGHVDLMVNLEGRDAAERTGILVVRNFKVLGDPVVTEVITSAGGASSDDASGKRVVREVYSFDQMRVPFAAGHDQFVLEDSYVRGPLVGATVRGKVDFKSQRLDLGGTYIPLQGLNSALCAIPLLGAIITGPKCEGVVGITFAVQGAMSQPTVLVNPLSMFTPGILREIMQMTDPSQKVQAREAVKSKVPASQRTGNSSSEPVRAGTGGARAAPGNGQAIIDGWSSQTTTKPKKQP